MGMSPQTIEMQNGLDTITAPAPKSKRSSLHAFKDMLKNITVEPLIFFFITPRLISLLANENMNLEKACYVNLAMNSSICDALVRRDKAGYTPEDEIEVQRLVSGMIPYKSAATLLPIFALLFLGAWSDRTGKRKPLLLIPFFGDIIAVLGYFLCIYFFMELRMEYAIFFESIPPSILGGFQLLMMACYSYVASISDETNRTVRIGAVSLTARTSMTLGVALSGFFFTIMGYYGVYSMGICFLICGMFYCMFCLKEASMKKTGNMVAFKEYYCKEIMNFGSITSSLRTCFKKGPDNRRFKMIIIQLIGIINFALMHGEDSFIYLYTRKQLGWDGLYFSVFKSYKVVVQVSGSAFIIVFLSKYLQWNDAKIGLVSIISKMLGSAIIAFADRPFILYAGATAEALMAATAVSTRSLMSKTVDQDELAKANSMANIIESIGPVISGPLYAMVYYETLPYFPGAIFLLSVLLNIPLLICFLILHELLRKVGK